MSTFYHTVSGIILFLMLNLITVLLQYCIFIIIIYYFFVLHLNPIVGHLETFCTFDPTKATMVYKCFKIIAFYITAMRMKLYFYSNNNCLK